MNPLRNFLVIVTVILAIGATPAFGQAEEKDKPTDLTGTWVRGSHLFFFDRGGGFDVWYLKNLTITLAADGTGEMTYRMEQLGTRNIHLQHTEFQLAKGNLLELEGSLWRVTRDEEDWLELQALIEDPDAPWNNQILLNRRIPLEELAESDRKAVGVIQDSGGAVTRDSEREGKPITGIDLSDTRIEDADLPTLKGLSHVQRLDLSTTAVTDAGLAAVVELQGLQELNLYQTKVTSAGLSSLVGLKQLQTLNLSNTQVADIQPLQELSGLQGLDLSDTPVIEANLQTLVEFKELRRLNLSGTSASDASLVLLKDHSHLEWLALDGTSVTDAGLSSLTGLSKLKGLVLGETKVTDAGVGKLEKALPECEIVR